jgi:hypothetical protein
MATVVTKPQGRIPVGFATVGGQRVPITIDIEWDRYLSTLTTELNRGLAGFTGASGQAGAAIAMLSDDSGSQDEPMFIVQNIIGSSTGGALWTEVEVDFGSDPAYEASFTITDAGITAASKVQVLPCGKAATGRTADDWQWDGATFAANPGSGSATCYAVFTPGPIVGRRKVQYSVGA